MINCCLGASALGAIASCFDMFGSLIDCLNGLPTIIEELVKCFSGIIAG